jgi:predicted aspartyl protease
MRGSIDGQFRPMLRILRTDGRDDLIGLVDSGFNGTILVHETDLDACGFRLREGQSDATLANGQKVTLDSAVGVIDWFGKARRVEVLVTREAKPPQKPDDPVLLLGGALFSPHRLVLDYATQHVEVLGID